MILEVIFNNYRLFKGDSSFSFVADGRTKKLLSNSTELDGKRVLKSLAVYGPNNSGKSLIYHLFKMIKDVLMGKDDISCNRDIFDDNPISSISVTYNNLDNKGWIRYSFSFDSKTKRYIKEKLSTIKYYSIGTPFERAVFEKDYENKVFKVFDNNETDLLSVLSLKSPILYSLELNEGKFSPLLEWLNSLKALADSIEPIQMFNIPISKTIEALKGNDENEKKFISDFAKDADVSVDGISYKKELEDYSDDQQIDEEALSSFKDLPDLLHLSTSYGKKTVPSLFFDSSGTKKMEALAAYIYDAVKNGKTLIVDELDNGLHFDLTRAIVSAMNNMANKKGQILFTAHDLMLIDCKMLLRKDQIYFLIRDKSGASLTCLKDATVSSGGPREGANLIKRYNSGDFGSLPNPSFIKELIALRGEGGKNG